MRERERDDGGSDVHMQQAFCFSAFNLEGDKTENQVLPVFEFAECSELSEVKLGLMDIGFCKYYNTV